jgi:hypothetical protein
MSSPIMLGFILKSMIVVILFIRYVEVVTEGDKTDPLL